MNELRIRIVRAAIDSLFLTIRVYGAVMRDREPLRATLARLRTAHRAALDLHDVLVEIADELQVRLAKTSPATAPPPEERN